VIEEIADILVEPSRPGELLRTVFTLAGESARSSLDSAGVERIGIVAHHLFSPPKRSQGVFLPIADLADPSGKVFLKAYRMVAKAEPPEEIEAEGVVKELQAM
jgi:hypothetical protein